LRITCALQAILWIEMREKLTGKTFCGAKVIDNATVHF